MLYTNDILDRLFETAQSATYRNRVAVEQVDGTTLTYAELVQKVDNLAHNLIRSGFAVDDRALILVRPSAETMILVLGIIRAGGTVIIGDLAMGKDVFESRMRVADVRWVFAESILLLLQKWQWLRQIAKQRGLEVPEMSRLGDVRVVNVGAIPFLGDIAFSDSLRDVNQRLQVKQRDISSDLMIIFTSGTTGDPKGVVHTLHSTQSILKRIEDHLQLNEDDVLYTYALHLTLPVLLKGGKAVLPAKKNSPRKTLESYRKYGITKTFEVPAMMQKIVDLLEAEQTTFPVSLRTILLGAAPVFTDFLHRMQQRQHDQLQIYAIYGMTEMLPACMVSLEDKLAFDPRKGDLVGVPLDGVQVSLNEDSELVLAGDGLFDRYLGYDPVSRHATGDIASISDGHVVLLGRKKNMIIRGNYNIYPLLFEPTIRMIAGVHQCAMIGVYNPAKADEEVVLFVDGTIDMTCLREALLTGDHSIDQYAQPDHIIYHDIPVSGRSDKIDRLALQQIAYERLNLEAATVLSEPVS